MTDKQKRIAYLEAALKQIAKKKGALGRDRLEHTQNCVEDMAFIATTALLGEWMETDD